MDPLVEGGIRRRGLTGGAEPVDMRRSGAWQVAQFLNQPRLQGVGGVDPTERVDGLCLHPGPTMPIVIVPSE